MGFKIKNAIRTFINVNNFEYYFIDFNKHFFGKHAKQIYENVRFGLQNDTQLAHYYFQSNILELEELSNKKNASFLKEIFKYDTFDWKIVSCRTNYAYSFTNQVYENYAQITMKYNYISDNNKYTKYIVLQRNFLENVSYHSWKIMIPDYNKYI